MRLVAPFLLLCACSVGPGPPALPTLHFERPSAELALIRVSPLPLSAQWWLQPSASCGAVDGPVLLQGDWPLPEPLILQANRGDLLSAELLYPGGVYTVSDCIPPLSWDSAF